MESEKIKQALLDWSKLNYWYRVNMPVAESYVASDILLTVFLEPNSKVKDLFLSIPHSYTAIRYHYKRLISEGWLEQHLDHTDRRVKYVKASNKLERALISFSEKLISQENENHIEQPR